MDCIPVAFKICRYVSLTSPGLKVTGTVPDDTGIVSNPRQSIMWLVYTSNNKSLTHRVHHCN